MSQREGFTGGFLAGAVFGGLVGGILGAALVSRTRKGIDSQDKSFLNGEDRVVFDTEEEMERARRSLEDKIAQLNHAIDDVRQQLGAVPSNNSELG